MYGSGFFLNNRMNLLEDTDDGYGEDYTYFMDVAEEDSSPDTDLFIDTTKKENYLFQSAQMEIDELFISSKEALTSDENLLRLSSSALDQFMDDYDDFTIAFNELYQNEEWVRVGQCYENGFGVKQNNQLALKYYQEAIKKNPEDSIALWHLGRCCKKGIGTDINHELAFYYFEKAVNANPSDINDIALYDLGKCYLNGRGTTKDLRKAFECFNQAENNNSQNYKLWCLLADCYFYGTGTVRSFAKASSCYNRALTLNPNMRRDVNFEKVVKIANEIKDIDKNPSYLSSKKQKFNGHPAQRTPDFINLSKAQHQNKPLSKDLERFSAVRNGLTFGLFNLWKNVDPLLQSTLPTTYNLAQDNPNEYFVMEILNYIGLETPKIRVTSSNVTDDVFTATHHMSGLMPLSAFNFDIKNQLVKIKNDNTIYRLGGHLSTADIACLLIQDAKFNPAGNNLKLIKRGNKFYAVAINRNCNIKHSAITSYEGLFKNVTPELNCVLFAHKTKDQTLAMLQAIVNLITKDDKGISVLDLLLFNSRVISTPAFNPHEALKLKEAIEINAMLIINHYKKLYGADILSNFREREKQKEIFVKNTINKLHIHFAIPNEYEQLVRDILEDLRGPYYQSLFNNRDFFGQDMNNEALRTKIQADIQAIYGFCPNSREKVMVKIKI